MAGNDYDQISGRANTAESSRTPDTGSPESQALDYGDGWSNDYAIYVTTRGGILDNLRNARQNDFAWNARRVASTRGGDLAPYRCRHGNVNGGGGLPDEYAFYVTTRRGNARGGNRSEPVRYAAAASRYGHDPLNACNSCCTCCSDPWNAYTRSDLLPDACTCPFTASRSRYSAAVAVLADRQQDRSFLDRLKYAFCCYPRSG